MSTTTAARPHLFGTDGIRAPFGEHPLDEPTVTAVGYQLGRTLAFDPKAEKFVKDPQADQLLTREYREPFAVPEKV